MNTKRNIDNELMQAKDLQSKTKINQDSSKIFNLLSDIRKLLKETVEVEILYYGYSNKKDLFIEV